MQNMIDVDQLEKGDEVTFGTAEKVMWRDGVIDVYRRGDPWVRYKRDDGDLLCRELVRGGDEWDVSAFSSLNELYGLKSRLLSSRVHKPPTPPVSMKGDPSDMEVGVDMHEEAMRDMLQRMKVPPELVMSPLRQLGREREKARMHTRIMREEDIKALQSRMDELWTVSFGHFDPMGDQPFDQVEADILIDCDGQCVYLDTGDGMSPSCFHPGNPIPTEMVHPLVENGCVIEARRSKPLYYNGLISMEGGDLIWRAGAIQETLDSLEDAEGVDDYVLESIPDGPPDYPRYYVTRYLPDYFRAVDDQTVFQVSYHGDGPGKRQTLTPQPASYYESLDGCRRVSRAEAHEHMHGRYEWDQAEEEDGEEEKEDRDGGLGPLSPIEWVNKAGGVTDAPSFQVPVMNIIESRAMGDSDFMIVCPTPTGPRSVSISGVGPFEVDPEEMKEHYTSVEEEIENIRKEKAKEKEHITPTRRNRMNEENQTKPMSIMAYLQDEIVEMEPYCELSPSEREKERQVHLTRAVQATLKGDNDVVTTIAIDPSEIVSVTWDDQGEGALISTHGSATLCSVREGDAEVHERIHRTRVRRAARKLEMAAEAFGLNDPIRDGMDLGNIPASVVIEAIKELF